MPSAGLLDLAQHQQHHLRPPDFNAVLPQPSVVQRRQPPAAEASVESPFESFHQGYIQFLSAHQQQLGHIQGQLSQPPPQATTHLQYPQQPPQHLVRTFLGLA